MALNMQQKFVMVLEAHGFAIVKRGKYITMGKDTSRMTGTNRPAYLYVGKSGSLRRGPNQASSYPIRDESKRKLLAEYETLMPPGF